MSLTTVPQADARVYSLPVHGAIIRMGRMPFMGTGHAGRQCCPFCLVALLKERSCIPGCGRCSASAKERGWIRRFKSTGVGLDCQRPYRTRFTYPYGGI